MQAGDGRGPCHSSSAIRFDAFWALRPSQEDVAGVFEHLGELYPKDEDQPATVAVDPKTFGNP